MTKTAKLWGLGFKAAGVFALGLFGAILKGGPVTTLFLSEAWRSIGFLADTILENSGAWELLSFMTDTIIDLDDILQNAPESVKAFVGALAGFAITIGVVSVALKGLAIAFGLVDLAILPIAIAVGAVVGVLILLDRWWRANNDGVSIFTDALWTVGEAVKGFKLLVADLYTFIIKKDIPENWKNIWTVTMKAISTIVNEKVASIKLQISNLKTNTISRLSEIKTNWITTYEDMRDKAVQFIVDAKNRVIEEFDKMKAALTATIRFFAANPIVKTITTIASVGSRLAGRQTGGLVRSGESVVVGEGGPEIATFASSARITPNNTAKRTFGGRDTVVQLEINLDGRKLWSGLKRVSGREVKRMGA